MNHAQEIEPPKTSGEGDQSIQDIARSAPSPAGAGYTPPQENRVIIGTDSTFRTTSVLNPTTGGDFDQMAVSIGASAMIAGAVLLAFGMAIRSRKGRCR